MFLEVVEQMTYEKALQLFGLQAGSTLDGQLLKKKYRELAMKSHPDVNGNENDFNLLGAAYSYLQQFIGKRLPTPMETPSNGFGQYSQNYNPWETIHSLFIDIQNALDTIEMEIGKRSKNWPLISNEMASILRMDSQGFFHGESSFMKLKNAIKSILPEDAYRVWSARQGSFLTSAKNFITEKDRASFKSLKDTFFSLYDTTMKLKQTD